MIYERKINNEILRYLDTQDIIVIHGARQVGKTSILIWLRDYLVAQGQQVFYIDLEDSRFTALLDRGVDDFLNYLRGEGYDLDEYLRSGKKLFVQIDEIQYLSQPSSFLKLVADHRPEIKLIVSGSSSFEMKSKFKDSLVGRTVNFEIYPLSFQEMLTFRGVKYFPEIPLTDIKINELIALFQEYVLFGGYPKIVLTAELDRKERYLQQIIDTYIRKDIRDLAEIKDVNKFNRLVEILASQSGNLVNITELCNTCDLSRPTVERYLFLLEQTYILKLVRPYSTNLRSEISKASKVYFFDTGLMQMLWLKKLQKEIIGPVFETSIFAELVKAIPSNRIYYWRNFSKKEIDFVLMKSPGQLALVEAKLHFPKSLPAALNSFQAGDQGVLPKMVLVGLYGRPDLKEMVYPWELTKLLVK